MAEGIRRLPSLNGLRVFEVVTRHLNFRLAAEEIGVTQGAVAQQIRGLEAELGLKLFDRLPRTLSLTEAGQSYVTNIRRAFELISEATETLKPEPLHLTISVTPTFASKWLIPRLPDFTATHPNIDLRILASDRIANFQTDAVDLAVRHGRPPFGPNLNAELLFNHIIIAVGSPLLVEKLGRPSQGDNLAHYPLLHDGHDLWPQFLELAFPHTPLAGAKNIRFNQTSLAIEAAIAGQGLALTSTFFVEDDLAAGRLLRVLPTELTVGTDFYVVSPRKPRHPASVAAVRNWLARQTCGNRPDCV
ncbi:LysR substrate-binding domain-containing protein [Rhizobium sp. YTU87027]|uniref:LysR substrate-binding domain-containing protein n=1 Tax=Rhizobium sp. YTU87027 TaxID=3417741 RepID=UPI003D694A53